MDRLDIKKGMRSYDPPSRPWILNVLGVHDIVKCQNFFWWEKLGKAILALIFFTISAFNSWWPLGTFFLPAFFISINQFYYINTIDKTKDPQPASADNLKWATIFGIILLSVTFIVLAVEVNTCRQFTEQEITDLAICKRIKPSYSDNGPSSQTCMNVLSKAQSIGPTVNGKCPFEFNDSFEWSTAVGIYFIIFLLLIIWMAIDILGIPVVNHIYYVTVYELLMEKNA